MSKKELLSRLESLKSECSNAHDLHHRAHESLHIAIIKTLLFWMACQKEPGFLDELYKKHKIQDRPQSDNTPNFRAILRVTFGLSKIAMKEHQKMAKYNAAMRVMYLELIANEERYRNNPERSLLDFLNNNGKLKGLGQIDEQERKDRDENPKGKIPVFDSKRQQYVAPYKERPIDEVNKDIRKMLPSKAGYAEFPASTNVRTTKGQMCVFLGHRKPDGAVTVLSSTSDFSVIRQIMNGPLTLSLADVHNDLRLIVETLRTQMYPRHAMPSDPQAREAWTKEVLDDVTKLKTSDLATWEEGQTVELLRSSKRLLVRGSHEAIYLSSSKLASSVVTRCKPFEFAFVPNQNSYLHYASMCLFERMIETGEIYLHRVFGAQNLHGLNNNTPFCYLFFLARGDEVGHTQISFYDAKIESGEPTGFQADFDFETVKADWGFVVQPHWFAQLREQCLDEWFMTLGKGNQIKRDNNQVMRVSLSPTRFNLAFNLSADNGVSPSIDMPARLIGETPKGPLAFWSKDIAVVLYNIADQEILGNVEVIGNSSCIVFSYTTKVGRFDVAIPTLEKKRSGYRRNEDLFSEYHYG